MKSIINRCNVYFCEVLFIIFRIIAIFHKNILIRLDTYHCFFKLLKSTFKLVKMTL